MNTQHINPFQPKVSSLVKNNHPLFRIRSSSKEKCQFSNKNQKENSFDTISSNKIGKHNVSEKIKVSTKELKKIFSYRRHQRQRSTDIQSSGPHFLQTLEHAEKKNDFMTSKIPTFENNQKGKRFIFENVRTQQSHLQGKAWIDINSIDTSEDIKILDRITNLCDPFRMINQCNSRKEIQRKSGEQRFKSMSAKKSKLTEKINKFVFQMAPKSKPKSRFDLHRKKFQPLSKQNSQHKFFYEETGDPENHNKSIRKDASSPKLLHRKNNSPSEGQKKYDKHQKTLEKSLPVHRYEKNILLPSSQNKQKFKINVNQIKQNKKNETMDKFWSGVNQSLILAAQEEYVSKDLNELLYNNMR